MDEYVDIFDKEEIDATARQMVREAFDHIRSACVISRAVRKELVDTVKRITLGMPPNPVGPEYLVRELFEQSYKPRE